MKNKLEEQWLCVIEFLEAIRFLVRNNPEAKARIDSVRWQLLWYWPDTDKD